MWIRQCFVKYHLPFYNWNKKEWNPKSLPHKKIIICYTDNGSWASYLIHNFSTVQWFFHKKTAQIQSLDLKWGNSRGLIRAVKSCEWIRAVSLHLEKLQFLTQSSERENAAEPATYYISILMQKIQSKYFASHSFASSRLPLPGRTERASQCEHTKTGSATFSQLHV